MSRTTDVREFVREAVASATAGLREAVTSLQEVPVDGVVSVTTPFHTSVEDRRRSRRLFEENGVPVLGCVINVDRFVCDSCGGAHDTFPDRTPVDDLGMSVPARLPFSTALQAHPEPGTAPDAFGALAGTVTERPAATGRLDLPPDPVDIRGLDARARVDRVREAFEATASGEPL